MKKLLSLLAIAIMALSISLMATSCSVTPGNNTKSEVTLQSVSTSTTPLFEQTAMVKATALFAANTTDDTADAEDPSKTTTAEDAPGKEDLISDLESNLTVIYKTQTTIYFTINLTNPKNYYILDFKLSTDNPDDKIQVRQGSHYSYINDPNTFIRWDEASDRVGNHQATFEIVLPSPEISPSVIKISEMYYSDRNDGTNKTAVNMNNKDVFTVYKLDKTFEFVNRRNSTEEFSFGLNPIDNLTFTSIQFDGQDLVADENGVYHCDHDGQLSIKYEVVLGNSDIYCSSYTEDIEILKYEWTKTRNDLPYNLYVYDNWMAINVKITGTDADIRTVYNDAYAVSAVNYLQTQTYIVMQYEITRNIIETTYITIAGIEYKLTDFVGYDPDINYWRSYID